MKGRYRGGAIASSLLPAILLTVMWVATGCSGASAESPVGEWTMGARVRDFVNGQSIRWNARGIVIPGLNDPLLIVRGMGPYETNCRGCHGSLVSPPVGGHTRFAAPYLAPMVGRWSAAELFYIIKHGIYLTPMPAWPAAQRDDEIWAIVAFLRALPEMDRATYERIRTMGGGGTDAYECGICHGVDGLGRNGAYPSIAGQNASYIENSIEAFATDRRHSGTMKIIAAELTIDDVRGVAEYYASLSPPRGPGRVHDPATIERGRMIAEVGIPQQRVPSCADCHAPETTPQNAAYPNLAGQHAGYLVSQLELFRDNKRGGSRFADIMRPIANRLEREQMRDVAAYFEFLGSEGK